MDLPVTIRQVTDCIWLNLGWRLAAAPRVRKNLFKCSATPAGRDQIESLPQGNLVAASRIHPGVLWLQGLPPSRPPVLAEETQIKPKVIFWRGVDVLIREQIEVPAYFPLADQILSAIQSHNQTLVATLERTLNIAKRTVLAHGPVF